MTVLQPFVLVLRPMGKVLFGPQEVFGCSTWKWPLGRKSPHCHIASLVSSSHKTPRAAWQGSKFEMLGFSDFLLQVSDCTDMTMIHVRSTLVVYSQISEDWTWEQVRCGNVAVFPARVILCRPSEAFSFLIVASSLLVIHWWVYQRRYKGHSSPSHSTRSSRLKHFVLSKKQNEAVQPHYFH